MITEEKKTYMEGDIVSLTSTTYSDENKKEKVMIEIKGQGADKLVLGIDALYDLRNEILAFIKDYDKW